MEENKNRIALTKESADYQNLALTHIFDSMPNREALLSSKGIKAYDRQPFNEDSWIFQGTENDMEPIMEDIFGSIDSDLSDYEHNVAIARKCRSAVPLSFGDIGAVAISNKFKEGDRTDTRLVMVQKGSPLILSDLNEFPRRISELNGTDYVKINCLINQYIIDGKEPLENSKASNSMAPEDTAELFIILPQYKIKKLRAFQKYLKQDYTIKNVKEIKTQKIGQLNRQIWEDCSYSGGSVRIPQLTQTGACTIPSQYRPENIVKYAKVTFKQAVGLSRIYKYLEFDFKVVIKVNKAVRKRTCRNPWDIKITHDGLTLLELAEDLRGINVRMELESLNDLQYEDWCHYDLGFGKVTSKRLVTVEKSKITPDMTIDKDSGCQIRESDHTGLYQFKIMDNVAEGSHNELEEDELNPFEVVSMPNEFTYWNQSMIPTPACLLSKDTNKLFLKLRGIIVDRQITKKNLPKLSKFIRKLTPAQKLEIKKSVGIAYRQTADSFTEGMQDQIELYA